MHQSSKEQESKRRNKNATIVWIDLKNAFGSVPHDTMWNMMARLGVPADFHAICRDIYHNAVHTIRSIAGNTPLILLNQGIKQGCPLSPLLFNMFWRGSSLNSLPSTHTVSRTEPRPCCLVLHILNACPRMDAEWMKADLGLETSVLALVVGSWDNDNLPTLRALGIGKNYSVLFRKLCVSDAISGSHSIWTLRSSRTELTCTPFH